MIHLFKKIYIASDNHIDQFSPKKIIVSSAIGEADSYSAYEEFTNSEVLFSFKQSSLLIGPDGIFETHFKFFKHLQEVYNLDEKPIVLYLDKITTYEFLINWFNIILENNSFDNLLEISEFSVFYNRLYNSGSSHTKHFSSTAAENVSYEKLIHLEKDTLQNKITTVALEENLNFIASIKGDLSLEFLLSSYLTDKSYKDELKKKTRTFYKKSVDSFLYDLRDVFMLNCFDSQFMNSMGVTNSYDLANISEIFNDQSETCRVLFRSPVWNTNFFKGESSRNDGGLLNFQNLNNVTSAELIQLVDLIRHTDETIGTEIRFPLGKIALSLYGIAEENFSDSLLDQLIQEETTQAYEGIVYGPTIGNSVNIMLIKFLLTKFKLQDFAYLSKFKLKNNVAV